MRVWTCKVGGVVEDVPDGADRPMREAVRRAYLELTGREPDFLFTGWGGAVDPIEQEEVEAIKAGR